MWLLNSVHYDSFFKFKNFHASVLILVKLLCIDCIIKISLVCMFFLYVLHVEFVHTKLLTFLLHVNFTKKRVFRLLMPWPDTWEIKSTILHLNKDFCANQFLCIERNLSLHYYFMIVSTDDLAFILQTSAIQIGWNEASCSTKGSSGVIPTVTILC